MSVFHACLRRLASSHISTSARPVVKASVPPSSTSSVPRRTITTTDQANQESSVHRYQGRTLLLPLTSRYVVQKTNAVGYDGDHALLDSLEVAETSKLWAQEYVHENPNEFPPSLTPIVGQAIRVVYATGLLLPYHNPQDGDEFKKPLKQDGMTSREIRGVLNVMYGDKEAHIAVRGLVTDAIMSVALDQETTARVLERQRRLHPELSEAQMQLWLRRYLVQQHNICLRVQPATKWGQQALDKYIQHIREFLH